ncbi:hypothetical protein ACVWZL_000213 [Bradyrhizobium sp. GM2.4]
MITLSIPTLKEPALIMPLGNRAGNGFGLPPLGTPSRMASRSTVPAIKVASSTLMLGAPRKGITRILPITMPASAPAPTAAAKPVSKASAGGSAKRAPDNAGGSQG